MEFGRKGLCCKCAVWDMRPHTQSTGEICIFHSVLSLELHLSGWSPVPLKMSDTRSEVGRLVWEIKQCWGDRRSQQGRGCLGDRTPHSSWTSLLQVAHRCHLINLSLCQINYIHLCVVLNTIPSLTMTHSRYRILRFRKEVRKNIF